MMCVIVNFRFTLTLSLLQFINLICLLCMKIIMSNHIYYIKLIIFTEIISTLRNK